MDLAHHPVPLTLRAALRLGTASRLAVVGAGGKTTLLFRLAQELAQQAETGRPGRVLVTTTTHLAESQTSLADHHLTINSLAELVERFSSLPDGIVLLTGAASGDGRVSGVDFSMLEFLARQSKEMQIPLLVEADGSRLRPLKAPAAHEPALPGRGGLLDLVVVVAGMQGLGRPLTAEWVHRPELFAALSGLQPGQEITPSALARVLAHPQGGLKGLPQSIRRVAALNQAGSPELQAQGGGLAETLLKAFDAVIVSSLPEHVFAVHERVAGIVLAAGESSRFGQPKQLLPWRGEPLVRHSARAALEAGLSPVVVVCGAYSREIGLAVSDLPVEVVENPDWQAGQSTSLQCGLGRLPVNTGAAIFLLADQPQVPAALLRKLVEMHSASLSALVAPQAGGRRANPVLFDRVTFPELTSLRGDVGGRPLFSRYSAEWLPWHDDSLLLDVDSPEDYARLLQLA